MRAGRSEDDMHAAKSTRRRNYFCRCPFLFLKATHFRAHDAMLAASRALRALRVPLTRGLRMTPSVLAKAGAKAAVPAKVDGSLAGVLAKEIAYEAEEAGSEAQLAGLAAAIKAATGFTLEGACADARARARARATRGGGGKEEYARVLCGRVSLRASPPASPRPQTPVAARASR